MPRSAHQILIHGNLMNFLAPIVILSEESQEAHKGHKYIKTFNTRNIDRIVSNEKLINLLLSSDPLISSFRKAQPYPKYHSTKLNEVKKLLQNIENGENDYEIGILMEINFKFNSYQYIAYTQ